MPLEQYKDLVGSAAAVVTAAQFFSPVFICKKIVNQGSTENVDPTPFVGGLGMGLLMLQQGLLLGDVPMIAVNVLALVLNLCYTAVYYLYTTQKGKLILTIGRTLFFALAIIAYANIDSNPDRVDLIYSSIVTVLLLSLIGAPLLEVKQILATKNAEKLPFPLILSGTVVTFLWLLYGIIINNVFMQFQNVVGFALSFVQLGLCLMYPGPKDKAKKKE